MVKYLKEENFEEEIKKEWIMVDFYADWCGPCRALGEVLETIENVDILKVNVDEHQEIAARFGVMSIPTIIIFKNGVEVAKQIGMLPRQEFLDWIEKNRK